MLHHPFRGADAIARGLVTAGELRGPRFTQVFRGIHVARRSRLDLRIRSRAAFLLVNGDGAVGGWSAAELLGASCGPVDAPAELVVPGGNVRARPGLIVHRERLDAGDVTTAAGCRVTTPLRTAWDLARRLDPTSAVVALDALARCGGFVPAELLARRDRRPGARGCRDLDAVVALADPRAESPMETRLRLLLVLGGLPAPHVQYRIKGRSV